MLNRWNGLSSTHRRRRGIARRSPSCPCIPHYTVVSGHFLTRDRLVNCNRTQVTTLRKAHSGCFEAGQTPLVPLSLLSLRFFGPSGEFLWSVFVNTRGEELWTAARTHSGRQGEAGLCVRAERERESYFDYQQTTQLDELLFMKMSLVQEEFSASSIKVKSQTMLPGRGRCEWSL